jgi:hypothetical protein
VVKVNLHKFYSAGNFFLFLTGYYIISLGEDSVSIPSSFSFLSLFFASQVLPIEVPQSAEAGVMVSVQQSQSQRGWTYLPLPSQRSILIIWGTLRPLIPAGARFRISQDLNSPVKILLLLADRQAASIHSYKNIQDSHTLSQRKINKPTKS